MKRSLIAAIVLAVALYVGDLLWLQFRAWRKMDVFGSVTLETYYAVKLKNGKIEYDYGGQQDVECVRALFPHSGDKPCWYASRKKEQEIKIDSGNPNNLKLF